MLKVFIEKSSSANCDLNEDGLVTLSDIIYAARISVTVNTSGIPLFTPHVEAGIYNYCPTVIEDADNTRYVYYCTNKDPYQIVDYIGFRTGSFENGKYTWSDETKVLAPTPGEWDSMHVCDPSVIKGSFMYRGEDYSYLMAYLGCSSTDNQENKIGIAVAKSPEGPFTKVSNAPLVDFSKSSAHTDIFQWGVGQASLVSIDKKSKVWMFYTRGDIGGTRTVVRECDFSNLDAPVIGEELTLAVSGLITLDGNPDILNNADFMYDPENDIFYSASDCHPNPAGEPNYISSHFRLARFSGTDFSNAVWKNITTAGESSTGFARNHNVGLVRNEHGYLPQKSNLATVYYTVSEAGPLSLWSYRIHEYKFPI
jgi:hypothetical protein